MILSRRSFLKIAGLTVLLLQVLPCSPAAGSFLHHSIKVVAAKDLQGFQAAVQSEQTRQLVVWPA